MRFDLPSRIPVGRTVFFLALLFCVQQFQRTNLLFSVLFFLFVVMGNVAFNLAGGFTRVAGGYAFFSTLLLCGFGVLLKAIVGEAADSNLKAPTLMMSVYTAAMAMLLLVVVAVTRFNRGRRSLPAMLEAEEFNYTLSAWGCLLFSVIQDLLGYVLPSGSGTLLGVLHQLNVFPALAVILGTIGAIRDSDGRRTVNLASGLALLYLSSSAFTSFSKQAMLTPGACWLVGAFFCRLRVSRLHAAFLLLYGLAAFTWIPLLASGRDLISGNDASFSTRFAVAVEILTHQKDARAHQKETVDAARAGLVHATYYDEPLGFAERLTIIPVDDAFFDYSSRGNRIGYLPVLIDFENYIPHFLYANKPDTIGGNYYAHQVGGFLAEDDFSTGISFSPQAEAFYVDGWVGVLLLLPAIWLALFVLTDLVCGDLRRTPWGLFVVLGFAHSAAESLLGGLIYSMVYGNLIFLIAILFCTKVSPILGAVFSPTRQDALDPLPSPAVRALPGRYVPGAQTPVR